MGYTVTKVTRKPIGKLHLCIIPEIHNDMKQLTKNWNLMRWVRFALGIVIIIEGIRSQLVPLSLMGAVFAALAFFGVGQCGCAFELPNTKHSAEKTVEYEEVK